MKTKIKLMLDSGAYGAWKRNISLPIEGYIDFINEHKHLLHSYVNMDVIPEQSSSVSAKTIDRTAKATWKNLRAMLKAGLEPMGVYHIGERRYWLEKMIGEGCKYIGLGGLASLGNVAEEIRFPWLNSVFQFLCGKNGYPPVKMHGFAITSPKVLHRYPWASVDSVSWRMHGAYGWIIVPKIDQYGGYMFKTTPMPVYTASGTSDGTIHSAATEHKHFGKMGLKSKAYVKKYLKSEGFDIQQVLDDRIVREEVSIRFYRRSGEAFQYSPFHTSSPSLLDNASDTLQGSKEHPKTMEMFFGAAPSTAVLEPLQKEGISRVLLSYYYFRNRMTMDLNAYVTTGDIKMQKCRKKN